MNELLANASPDVHSYVRFDVSGLNGAPVSRVTLQLYVNNASSSSLKALVVTDNTWDEKVVTYDTAPTLGSSIATSSTLASGTWITLDVTSYVTGEGTYSFGMTTPGSSTISVASREAGAHAPKLTVEFGP